jgi:hypothetical protein
VWWRRDKEDEDPFAALRDGTAGAGSSASIRPDGERSTRSSGRGIGIGIAILLTLVLLVAGLGVAIALILPGEIDRATGVVESTPGAATPAQPGDGRTGDAEPPPPRSHDLVRPAGMGHALRVLRRTMHGGEVLDSLRVAPERIDAIVHSPRSERQRVIDVADDLAVRATASGQRDGDGMRLARVDAAAPWRAARGAARHGGFPVRRLDYLVLSAPIIAGQAPTWSLFFDGVRLRNSHWIASLDGRVVHRPGQQPSSSAGAGAGAESGGSTTSTSTLTVTRNGGKTTYRGPQAERITRCVRAAGSDGAAIQRCLP